MAQMGHHSDESVAGNNQENNRVPELCIQIFTQRNEVHSIGNSSPDFSSLRCAYSTL